MHCWSKWWTKPPTNSTCKWVWIVLLVKFYWISPWCILFHVNLSEKDWRCTKKLTEFSALPWIGMCFTQPDVRRILKGKSQSSIHNITDVVAGSGVQLPSHFALWALMYPIVLAFSVVANTSTCSLSSSWLRRLLMLAIWKAAHPPPNLTALAFS